MALSSATVTHLFANADQTPSSGSVECTLSGRLTNGGTTIMPASITTNLSPTGGLSVVLVSNVDSGTVPPDTRWEVVLRIAGAQEETFSIVVPTGGGTIDLGTLLPSAQQVG